MLSFLSQLKEFLITLRISSLTYFFEICYPQVFKAFLEVVISSVGTVLVTFCQLGTKQHHMGKDPLLRNWLHQISLWALEHFLMIEMGVSHPL